MNEFNKNELKTIHKFLWFLDGIIIFINYCLYACVFFIFYWSIFILYEILSDIGVW